jgi:PAS domain S-box-containing protein
VALSIMQLCSDENVTSGQLANLVQSDPALTGRLLRQANASTDGMRPVLSALDAVNRLGLQSVRQLALGFSLVDQYGHGECEHFNYSVFWSHSLLMAVTVKKIGRLLELGMADELFSCGLLSRVGCLALATAFPIEYSAIMVRRLEPQVLLAEERKTFDTDHLAMTDRLLKEWGLTGALIESLKFHENPETVTYSHGTPQWRLAYVFHLSRMIANFVLQPSKDPAFHISELRLVAGKLGIDESVFIECVDDLLRQWRTWGDSINVQVNEVASFVAMMESQIRPDQEPQNQWFKVLVAGEDARTVDLINSYLRDECKYETLTTNNSQDALSMALKFKPHAVLTQGSGPHISSAGLCQALEANSEAWERDHKRLSNAAEDLAQSNQRLQRAESKRIEGQTHAHTQEPREFAAAVQDSSDALVITDANHRVIWVNADYERLIGFSTEEALGRTLGEVLLSSEIDPQTIAAMHEALFRQIECKSTLLKQASNATQYLLKTEIQPIKDEGGDLKGYVGIASHVTERRRTQAQLKAALRDNEALLGAMNLHAITSTADRTGVISDVNDAFCDISGYVREELIGQNHRIVNSGTHTQAIWADMWQTISTGMPWRGDLCNRAKNGNLYWVDTFVVPIMGDDGLVEKFMSIHTDITDRKEAQHESARNSALLRGSIEAIDEALVLYDPQDRLVFCNEKYRQTYREVAHLMVPGTRFEDIIRAGAEQGQYLAAIGRVDEWVAERVATHQSGNSALVQRLANGRSLRIIERKLEDGHIVGFLVDITELTQATDAAQAAALSKSQFLANMNHEIRTPMNAILGMLMLLRKTPLTAKQSDYAAKSEGAARSLLGLINEILDFSKIEAGKMTLNPQPFEVDQFVRDLSVLLSASAGSKAVEMLFDIDPQTPTHLLGDSMRIQQVLLNLGSNAIKFTTEGEVKLSIKVTQRSEDAVSLLFSMQDTGIGIAPENHARIFNGFTQAESSSTRRFGGIGLGVAISQRFVTKMGGELQLQSALGEGSRFYFTITLPLAPEAKTTDPTDRSHLRALAIDDNAASRLVLEQMEKTLQWLETAKQVGERYQAVFVDSQMPGMDAVPVIAMVTAHGRDILAQRTEAEQTPLDGILVKPLTATMLRDAVQHAHTDKSRVSMPHTAQADSTQRLRDMHILVVEDNPNNQQVARELLETEGAIVHIASDGQEGVDAVALADPPFDVVLMDLQMPAMDGFTATRHIREVLGKATLPIVAMTANAMASDREACLAAGMNDHIGKPFDLNALVRMLRKQAHWAETDAEPEMAPPEVTQLAAVAAERAGFDIVGALQRLGGDQALYQQILAIFVRDLSDMPAQLQSFGMKQQAADAKRMLHTLKGLAATLGATELSAVAARYEKQLSTETTTESLAQAIRQTCEAIEFHSVGLHALLAALDATKPGTASSDNPEGPKATLADPAALHTALQALAQSLRNRDIEFYQFMGEIQLHFGDAMGATLEPLAAAIADLDLEGTVLLCESLIDRLHLELKEA